MDVLATTRALTLWRPFSANTVEDGVGAGALAVQQSNPNTIFCLITHSVSRKITLDIIKSWCSSIKRDLPEALAGCYRCCPDPSVLSSYSSLITSNISSHTIKPQWKIHQETSNLKAQCFVCNCLHPIPSSVHAVTQDHAV